MKFLFLIFMWMALCQCEEVAVTENYVRDAYERDLLDNPYFFVTDWSDSDSMLGKLNPDAAIGNPMKGITGSPLYGRPPLPDYVPASLEFYYIGLDSVMFGNPDKVGAARAFKWDYVESLLKGSAARNSHAIIRFYIHFPGRELRIPQYLVDEGILLVEMGKYGLSPAYGDPRLLNALRQFIEAFGATYDGDRRIYCIQLGLIGVWGEGHTFLYTKLLPDTIHNQVIQFYINSFKRTKIMLRQVRNMSYSAGLGLHDDSFGYSTLDGIDNGGVKRDWFFWTRVVTATQQDFWERGPMGGETRPELQKSIFLPTYPAGSEYKQSFIRCVNVTHATWMFHHGAFRRTNPLQGQELANARFAHARMGYNFVVTNVAVAKSREAGKVDIEVKISQQGIAPFYYPLSLFIDCATLNNPLVSPNVERLVVKDQSSLFAFEGIPASRACLDEVSIYLNSSYIYAGRPIKFAQGTSGSVKLKIPMTASNPTSIVTATTSAPSKSPSPVKGNFKSFTLINASTDTVLFGLRGGITVRHSVVGKSLDIRADFYTSSVDSVTFYLDNKIFITKTRTPFSTGGESGSFHPIEYMTFPGIKKIRGIASYRGKIVGDYSITFTLVT